VKINDADKEKKAEIIRDQAGNKNGICAISKVFIKPSK
jgi:hypothetical protein